VDHQRVTAAEVEKHKKLFIRMPAYKDRLKPRRSTPSPPGS